MRVEQLTASAEQDTGKQQGTGQKVQLDFDISLEYVISGAPADFLCNVHAASTDHQRVEHERLELSQNCKYTLEIDGDGNRWLRLRADAGVLRIHYAARVSLGHVMADALALTEVPIAALPLSVLKYLRSSRYCQSDRLLRLALNEFGHIPPGGPRVLAVQDWVRRRVVFRPQTSTVTTSAMDTLIEQVGVCRDYAHLTIALCRALNIPARFATGIDYGADPALGPMDFHAYVEVFLSGRWYILDPSGLAVPMGFVRLGTGRDAADVAFATMFGNVQANAPLIHIEARSDGANLIAPHHTELLLSTSAV